MLDFVSQSELYLIFFLYPPFYVSAILDALDSSYPSLLQHYWMRWTDTSLQYAVTDIMLDLVFQGELYLSFIIDFEKFT